MARPTKLTPEVEGRLLYGISLGVPYRSACEYAGISYQTFLNWRKHAEQGDERFVGFLDRIKRVQGQAAVVLLAQIKKAAERDWRAAAWSLERRYPESYNLRRLKPDCIEEVAPTPISAPAPGISKDDFAEITKALEKLKESGFWPS